MYVHKIQTLPGFSYTFSNHLYVPGTFVASNMAGRGGYDEREHRQVNKHYVYI